MGMPSSASDAEPLLYCVSQSLAYATNALLSSAVRHLRSPSGEEGEQRSTSILCKTSASAAIQYVDSFIFKTDPFFTECPGCSSNYTSKQRRDKGLSPTKTKLWCWTYNTCQAMKAMGPAGFSELVPLLSGMGIGKYLPDALQYVLFICANEAVWPP